jgi:hypothetical protein
MELGPKNVNWIYGQSSHIQSGRFLGGRGFASRKGEDCECESIVHLSRIGRSTKTNFPLTDSAFCVRAAEATSPQDAPPHFGPTEFFWASYVGGKDIDEVWSLTDLVNGHKRRPECRNILCGVQGGALNSQQMAHMSHHRPPYMPERCGIRPTAP